jgi:nucleobase:cation symporter-1, NCS1 family
VELVGALGHGGVARDRGRIVALPARYARAMHQKTEGSWGIEPVPERLRVLGLLDTGLLWGNLGVSLLVIVAGAALVPALSLPEALAAIVLGSLIGNLMLAVAGAIGADARVPGMVLMRASLGRRGSYLPTGINILQGLGWSVFELLIIATAAAALSDKVFGFRTQWLWTLFFGVVTLALALMGPIGFVRRFVRKVAVWAVPFAIVYLTWWTLHDAGLAMLWHKPGEGGLSVWQGADVVVGITVSWVPYAPDYTRFCRKRRDAFVGTGLGYFVPDVWLLALGAVLVLSRSLTDPAQLPTAVVAGGFAATLALFALLVTETDEAFANVYSAAVSLQNLVPRVSQKLLIALVTASAVVGALLIDLVSYQSFLLLLGSFFVPLFAVLLADWLTAGRHYTEADVFDAPEWRPGLVAAWGAGFAVYQWLYPTGPSRWVDVVGKLHSPDWGVGATVPSFLVAFALAGAVCVVSRRSQERAATA